MTRWKKIWLAVSAVFLAVNVGGAIVAALAGELGHAGVHVALIFPAAFLVLQLAPRRNWRALPGQADTELAGTDELSDRLAHLEQSLDVIGIEVERVGEGQRSMTHALTDRGAAHRHAPTTEPGPPRP